MPDCMCGHIWAGHDLGKDKTRTRCSHTDGPNGTPCGCKAYEARMAVNAIISQVTFSVLPPDHMDYHLFSLAVEWRDVDRYAVMRMRSCLGADGTWDYELQPSSREDDWLATHRFSYDEACALAVKHAPDVKCNGLTAREVAARG